MASSRTFIVGVLVALALCPSARAETYRLTLEQAERLLLERNQDLHSARAALDRDRAEGIIARQWPNLGFQFQQDHIGLGQQYSGSSPNNLTSQRFFVDNVVTAGLSWLMELGKRTPRQESAAHLAAASRANVLDAVRKKRSDLEAAFLAGLQAEEELRFAREVMASQQETVRINEARLRAGAIPESDLIKMRLELRTFETDVVQMELAAKKARSDLHELLGLRRGDEVVPVGQLLDERILNAPTTALEALLDRAHGLRPDLAGLQAQGARQAAELRLAQAQKIPDLTFSLGYQHDAPNSYLFYGVSLPLPVFNRYRGEELKARAEARRIAFDLVAARKRIANEVRSALWKFQSTRKLVLKYRAAYLAQADESRRIASFAYQRGQTSILEFLEAQRTYVAVRREWIRNWSDLRSAASALNAAVGERVLP